MWLWIHTDADTQKHIQHLKEILKKWGRASLLLCPFVRLMLNYSVLPCKSYNTYKVQPTGYGWTCLQLVSAPSALKPVNWPIKPAAWQHMRVSIHIYSISFQRMRDGTAFPSKNHSLYPLHLSPSSTLLQVNTFIRCHLFSIAVILTLTLSPLQHETTRY